MASGEGNVVLEKFELVMEGRPDPIVLDLTQPPEEISKTVFSFKEGVTYKIRLTFRVIHTIVSGLRYHHSVTRRGIKVDKISIMVGSYGPKEVPHVVLLDEELETKKGVMERGHCKVQSKFIDGEIVHKYWDWAFNLCKDWE